MTNASSRNERVFVVGIMLVSILLIIRSFTYPVASSAFPRFLSIVLLLLSTILVIRILRTGGQHAKEVPEGEAEGFSLVAFFKSPGVFVFVSVILYIVAMQVLGFLVSSVLFMFGCMWYLGNRNWVINIIWSLGFPILAYLIFHSLLRLQLPQGFLI